MELIIAVTILALFSLYLMRISRKKIEKKLRKPDTFHAYPELDLTERFYHE